MKAKKIALLGLASVITMGMGVSMAGGPARGGHEGIFIGTELGGFFNHTLKVDSSDITSVQPAQFGPVILTDLTNQAGTNVPSGLTAGGFVGYKFNRTWGLQFGYIWDQEQTLGGNYTGTVRHGNDITISSQSGHIQLDAYNLYLAARAQVHMFGRFGASFLIGPAWTYLKQKATFVTTTTADHVETDNFVSPMAAAAVTYSASRSMQFNLQYMYVSGFVGSKKGPRLRDDYMSTQRLTIGGTYLFAM